MLGGMGAEVIRVEAPGGGDIARTNPPFVGGNGIHFGQREEGEVSLTILNRGRNKKSITLDLKSEQGRELFMRLAEQADVVLENFSEGTTAKLGVDYERVKARNPHVIYASVKAMGEPSAFPGLKGMDIIVQALSGLMEVTGYADGPPTRCGLPIADMVAPMYVVNGILAALIHRGRTGVGQHVQVSMLDCLASWVAEEHFDVLGREGYPTRTGNYHDRLAPFGVYPTRDGHVAIVAFQPDWMRALLETVGHPELLDDPRFSTRGPRMRNARELNAVIQQWTSQHSTADVVRELLDRRGVPCAPVRKPDEVLHDRRLHDSGALMDLAHPTFGPVDAVGMGLPIRFSATPSQFDQPAMPLGSSNEEIYGGLLKLTEQDIKDLQRSGVV
jgi:formyl-CoA transferase